MSNDPKSMSKPIPKPEPPKVRIVKEDVKPPKKK